MERFCSQREQIIFIKSIYISKLSLHVIIKKTYIKVRLISFGIHSPLWHYKIILDFLRISTSDLFIFHHFEDLSKNGSLFNKEITPFFLRSSVDVTMWIF